MDNNKVNQPRYLIPGIINRILINMSSTYDYTITKNNENPNTFFIHFNNKTKEQIYNTYDKIFKALSSYHFSTSVFTPGEDTSSNVKYKTILVNSNKDISIKFYIGIQEHSPRILRPGMAFEEYVLHIILDQISHLKSVQRELGTPIIPLHIFNLTAEFTSSRKVSKIDKIVSVAHVGRANKKPDIKIIRRSKPDVKISLKQGNFGNWSQANTYSNALSILNNNINKKVIELNKNTSGIYSFKNNIDGFYVPATTPEVSKYCFGTSPDIVDYIIINSHFQGIDENNIIHINSEKIYENNLKDIETLRNDVFLLISYDPTSNATALKPYRGLRVQFVNSEVIKNGAKKYTQGIR